MNRYSTLFPVVICADKIIDQQIPEDQMEKFISDYFRANKHRKDFDEFSHNSFMKRVLDKVEMLKFYSKDNLKESVFDLPVYYSRLSWFLKNAGVPEEVLDKTKRDIQTVLKDAYDFGRKAERIKNS